MLNIYKILSKTSVEGPGIRFCIWVQGCKKHCPDCWAKDTWPFGSGNSSKFVDINNIRPDSYADGTNKQREYADDFVDIEHIKIAERTKEREIKPQEFQEMGDILYSVSGKINVNKAVASELSLLPGIDIVIAKKLVEYRDLNGLFATEDDFINTASVSEQFVQKIKAMITTVSDDSSQSGYDDYEDKAIDF